MKEIPIPECSNNRRTSMKCRRMCCRRPKPKPVKTTTQQTIWYANGKAVLPNSQERAAERWRMKSISRTRR